jgi:hypothetical protein
VLHKEIPFLRIGLPLCGGVISGLYIKPDIIFLVLISITISAGFIFSRFYNKYQTNLLFGLTISVSIFICGLLLYTNEKESISTLKPEQTCSHVHFQTTPKKKRTVSGLK